MTRYVRAIELKYILAFPAISLAPWNLGGDSMAPAERPFQTGCRPFDHLPTGRIDGGGHGL